MTTSSLLLLRRRRPSCSCPPRQRGVPCAPFRRAGPLCAGRNLATARSTPPPPPASPQSPFRRYAKLLDSHPLLTKVVTSGLIAASGDALCQSLFLSGEGAIDAEPSGVDTERQGTLVEEEDPPKKPPTNEPQGSSSTSTSSSSGWDWARTGRFGVLGTFLVAPTVHHWYNHLHRWTSSALLSLSPGRLLASRVAIDQLAFAPAFTAGWLVALWTLEGRLRQHHQQQPLLEDLRETVPGVVVANWALWVPAQCVNFAVVPLKFQVLYSNVVALAWNVYLSYATSRQTKGRSQCCGEETSSSASAATSAEP